MIMKSIYYLFFGGGSFGVIMMLSYLTYHYDGRRSEKGGETKKWTGIDLLCAATSCLGMAVMFKDPIGCFLNGAYGGERFWICAAAAGFFSGSLYFACMTDIYLHEAYDICWYVNALAAMMIWIVTPPNIVQLSGIGLFFLIQEIIFAKLYGKADCHAFCTCAMFGSGFGMEAENYFRHMVLSYIFLIVHQFWSRNIGKNGRLKVPVPFLPYITIAFFVNILQLPGQF